MEKKYFFKSKMNYYWAGISVLTLSVIIIDIFVVKTSKNFSFEFYFLMMIPTWIGVLGIYNHETDRIKDTFREYLTQKYPEKLEAYDAKPVELLNSDSEQILDLFQDQDLIKDDEIKHMQTEAKKVTTFMYSVFFLLPALLFSSVFFILKK